MVSIKLGKGQTISLSSRSGGAIVNCLLILHLYLLLLLVRRAKKYWVQCWAMPFLDVRCWCSVTTEPYGWWLSDLATTSQRHSDRIIPFSHWPFSLPTQFTAGASSFLVPLHWFSFSSCQLSYNCALRNLWVLLFRCTDNLRASLFPLLFFSVTVLVGCLLLSSVVNYTCLFNYHFSNCWFYLFSESETLPSPVFLLNPLNSLDLRTYQSCLWCLLSTHSPSPSQFGNVPIVCLFAQSTYLTKFFSFTGALLFT